MPRNTSIPPHPGVALRERRRNLGLTAAELAEAASVDLAMLTRVELGLRHPGDAWLGHVERVVTNLARTRKDPQR